MALLGLDIGEAAQSFSSKLKNPFDKYFQAPLDMKSALETNDFKNGFNFAEIIDGKEGGRRGEGDHIILKGTDMPHLPFSFGGTQKIVKDYYPGNSEPTVQVLGPRENDITIKGRFKAKRFRANSLRPAATVNVLGQSVTTLREADQGPSEQSLRPVPQELQQVIDGLRIRGNLLRIWMGEFQRFGFLEECNFDMKTIADIDYELKFTIIGFNPPKNCKIRTKTREIPFDINRSLIARAAEFQDDFGTVPGPMPRSLGDQISDAISDVAEAIGLFTGFVDTVLNEVDDIKASTARALGLAQHTRNSISSAMRRVGAIDPYGNIGSTSVNRVSDGYSNATYLKGLGSGLFDLTALIALMMTQLKEIGDTEPLARHRIQEGDTLQKIALKFYDSSENWKEIYDHNKLQSSELTEGEVLEIPRID